VTADDIDTTIPDGATPERCPHCGRPFPTGRLRDLHVGERHDPTEGERAAYESAREAESDELFVYHLKIVAAMVVLFFAFSYGYLFVWTS